MRGKLLLSGVLLFLSVWTKGADSAAVNTNLFHSPTAGFTITKPADWRFGSMEEVAANRAQAQLKDKELQEQMRKRASAPLVVVMKHPKPHDKLNPSVQVILRPLGEVQGKSATALMEIIVPTISRLMADFEVVEKIQEAKVGGLPAAYMKAKYTAKNQAGDEFNTLTRMWVVPRGAFLFMISMSGPQEGADVSEKEFKAILDSMKIAVAE